MTTTRPTADPVTIPAPVPHGSGPVQPLTLHGERVVLEVQETPSPHLKEDPMARKFTAAAREAAAAARAALLTELDKFADDLDEDEVAAAKVAVWAERYSERNAMLIVMQAPNATMIKGFRQWQAEGRQVRKGETGIRILAPAGNRAAEEPSEAKPDGEKGRQFFKLISVFDVAQTDAIEDVAQQVEQSARESVAVG